MLEPETSAEDIFGIVGFTKEDIAGGALGRSLSIAEEGFRTVAEVNRNSTSLWRAAQDGTLVKKLIEVYFIDSHSCRDEPAFAERYLQHYKIVHFYNATAMEIMQTKKIELPAVIATITRSVLPKHLGVGIRDYYYSPT